MFNRLRNPLCTPIIGFVGMSHLGLVSAIAIASKGFQVMCYDPDVGLVNNLQAGHLPIEEPELNEMRVRNGNLQMFTSEIEHLYLCDIIYISIDVPTRKDNTSDLSSIKALVEKVELLLGKGKVLVVLSQVPPGFTRQLPINPEQLFYQVETLIFGQALNRALHPERFIVGCSDPKQPLPGNYRLLLESFDCPLCLMRYESAELAKISINLFLISSVITANTLAAVSATVGADWNEIVPTLQLDKRIGPHAYLKPGLGISGGNLERDLATVVDLGDRFDVDVNVLKEWFENSAYQKDWVYRCLHQEVFCHALDPQIAVLGLAYKANTHSTKNSPSLALLEKIYGNKVIVHDPIASPDVVPYVTFNTDIEQTVAGADVLILMTPWPEYKNINAAWLKEKMQGRWIIDPLQILNHDDLQAEGFQVMTLGRTFPKGAVSETYIGDKYA